VLIQRLAFGPTGAVLGVTIKGTWDWVVGGDDWLGQLFAVGWECPVVELVLRGERSGMAGWREWGDGGERI
jgi:hypothetical protein